MNLTTTPAAPGLADRYAHGTGPAHKSWELPRAALGETAVCGTCGGVYFVSKIHRCKPRKARA